MGWIRNRSGICVAEDRAASATFAFNHGELSVRVLSNLAAGQITRSRIPRRERFLGMVEGTLTLSHGTYGRIGMEISVMEQVLRDAVRRGVPDEADVNAAVDGMWGARAAFKEAIKTP